MIKKHIFPLLLLASIQQLLPMDMSTTYNSLFAACEHGDARRIKAIIENNPAIDINHKDSDGDTPLLKAATHGRYISVRYLLCYGADKSVRAVDNHSLFSIIVSHNNSYTLREFLAFYTPDEINKECKNIPRNRNRISFIDWRITDVLEGTRDVHAANIVSRTALHIACIYKEIPAIIALLKRGASLDAQDKWDETPYQILVGGASFQLPFVIREAFNHGPHTSAALLLYLFTDTQPDYSLAAQLLPEITDLIKHWYISTCWVSAQERSAEAAIWKPVCVRACELDNFKAVDENLCLEHLLGLSQQRKTEINMQLLQEMK